MTIAAMFTEKGEAFFRQEEDKLLREIASRDRQVIATGGGMLLSGANREVAANAGLLIYLHAPIDVLVARVGNDAQRPLLGNQEPLQKLSEIFEQRRCNYEEIPTQVDTSRQSLRQTASQIVELYQEWLSS